MSKTAMNYQLLGRSGLRVSDLCLGAMTFGEDWGWGAAKDEARKIYDAYREAGGNFIDTANIYTNGSSEKLVGEFIAGHREEVVVATKGGYLAFDGEVPPDPRVYVHTTFINTGLASSDDIVEWNCITARYIEDQVERSLTNLGLRCIDIYYLHNPEAQLHKWPRPEFYRRIAAAFTVLEAKVADGKIRCYGTATWNGYRQPQSAREYLSLADLVSIAKEVGGHGHHFKVVQLPYNLAMLEALTQRNQQVGNETVSFLEAAHSLGITVMASATIMQGRLVGRLPASIGEALSGLTSDAQRAIQFTRSTPGITTALVGMKSIEHVEHNLETAKVPPATLEQFHKLFRERF